MENGGAKFKLGEPGPNSFVEGNENSGLMVESHLQSLGFTMENGKPRFRLGEPSMMRSGISNSGIAARSMDSCDGDSFVVLGKSSMDSIQASSMASYAQIQYKSMNKDYSSIIASLSPAEIEQKLTEVLQENVRLKETLTQNNLAMKEQFNTLATWQDEVMKVHQTHKQKFSETRDLINQLRRENSELKNKLTNDQSGSNNNDSRMRELELQLQKNFSEQTKQRTDREAELQEIVSKLTMELKDSRSVCQNLTADLERNIQLSDRLNQQLKRADQIVHDLKLEIERLELQIKEQERLASLADFSLIAQPGQNNSELQTLKEDCIAKDKDIKYMRELVASLEQQLKTANENTFAPIEIKIENLGTNADSQDRQQLIQNVKQYDEKLRSLSAYYAKQSSRYISVQDCLKESVNILQNFERTERSRHDGLTAGENLGFTAEEIEAFKDKLCEYRGRLIHEQLETINERQELIKAQNQFQKVFSDYASVLYELEILHEENAKLSCIQSQSSYTQESLKKSLEAEKTSLSQEKLDLSGERGALERERNSLEAERKNLECEKNGLEAERKNLESERQSLKQEKQLLDQQSKVKEAERKSFLMEKGKLQDYNEQLQTKVNAVLDSLRNKEESMEKLRVDIRALKQEAEKIPVLHSQLEVFRADFHEERQARETLATEKDKLVENVDTLMQRNQSLLQEIERLRSQGSNYSHQPNQPGYVSRYCYVCQQLTNQGEWHGWGFCQPALE